MKNITIIGATGLIGQPVAKELVNAGYRITALVRDIEKAKKVLPAGVNLIVGDLKNMDDLKIVLKDADGVFVSIANTYKDKEDVFNAEKQGLDNIIKAAKESNTKQIIFLSSFLARNYCGDWWIYKSKKSGIERVKNSGVPYTIFYASNFMENFTNGMVRGKSVNTIKSKLKNKSFWISGKDFGKQVASAFNTDIAFNREYSAQGLQGFTMEEVANEFAESYTKEKLKVVFAPAGLLRFLGILSPMIKFMSKLSAVNINNNETFEAEKTWGELGKPTTTIADFAKDIK